MSKPFIISLAMFILLLAVALVAYDMGKKNGRPEMLQTTGTSYTPLTEQQFKAEEAAGFSFDQIVKFEKIRKAKPPCPSSDPLGLFSTCTASTTGNASNPLGI